MYTFAHIELPVLDLKRGADFYSALFHWKFETLFGDDYLMIHSAEGAEIGGLSRVDEIPYINGFWNYVEVGDIEKTLTLAKSLGGKVIKPRTELPGNHGSYAVIQAPDGYNFGIWAKPSA